MMAQYDTTRGSTPVQQTRQLCLRFCAALSVEAIKPPVGQKKRCHVDSYEKIKRIRYEKVGPEGGPSERIRMKQASKAVPLCSLGQSIRYLLARLKELNWLTMQKRQGKDLVSLLDEFDWRERCIRNPSALLAGLEWMEPLVGNSGLA